MLRFSNFNAITKSDRRKIRSWSLYEDDTMECVLINNRYEIWADGKCYDEDTGREPPQSIYDLRDIICNRKEKMSKTKQFILEYLDKYGVMPKRFPRCSAASDGCSQSHHRQSCE